MNDPATVQLLLVEDPGVRPAHDTLLLLIGILWGLALPLPKIGVEAGGHPVGMGLWQVCTNSMLVAMLLLLRGRRVPLRADIARFGLVCGRTGEKILVLAPGIYS